MKHNLHKYLSLSEYFQGNVEKDIEDQIDCLVNQKNIPIQIYRIVSKINGSSVTKTIRLYPKEFLDLYTKPPHSFEGLENVNEDFPF